MTVEQEVIDIIVEQLGIDPSEVTLDKSFVEDLDLDSLDQTELIMHFEEKFGLEISEAQTEKLRTVGSVVEFIKSSQSASQS